MSNIRSLQPITLIVRFDDGTEIELPHIRVTSYSLSSPDESGWLEFEFGGLVEAAYAGHVHIAFREPKALPPPAASLENRR